MKGGQGQHVQLQMAITSLIMVQFSKLKKWLAAQDLPCPDICPKVPKMKCVNLGKFILEN